MFDRKKSDGLTFRDWYIEISALSDRLQLARPDDYPNFYHLNFSPADVLEFFNSEEKIKKNSRKIYAMRGFGKRLMYAMWCFDDISQSELSRNLEVAQAQISNFIRDKSYPRPILRQRLAATLRISYTWLSWNIGEPKTYKVDEYPEGQFFLTFSERLTYSIWSRGFKDLTEIVKLTGFSNTAFQYWIDAKRPPTQLQVQKNFGFYRRLCSQS